MHRVGPIKYVENTSFEVRCNEKQGFLIMERIGDWGISRGGESWM